MGTQQTSAKKKPAKKKAAKKPTKKAKKPKKKKAKKKKAKKKKKKKKKKAKKKKKKKKKSIGLFATKTLSADLAAICGKTKLSRPEMTKALWGYIKKNKLNKGRTITPDAKLKKVLPSNSLSMFKMAGMLKKHIK